MRFLLPGLGLNIALCGLSLPNLAVAAPLTAAPVSQFSPQLTIAQNAVEGTVIQGNGVEFTAPEGFQGGSPSGNEIKTLVRETARMFPSLASFVQGLDRDPTVFRAIAMNAATTSNPSIVMVTRLPFPATVSLTYLRDTMSKLMPTMLPAELKLVDSRVVNVGSRQIVKLTISGNLQGAKFRESIGLFKEGNDIYQVTYVFGNQHSGQAISIFEQMIRTFKATPNPVENSTSI